MWFTKQSSNATLVKVSFEQSVEMLAIAQQMFKNVTQALLEHSKMEDWDDLATIDKKLNKMHRNIRKKLFEHLSLSGGGDLFNSLSLLNVINDIERIGDYNKNIADIIKMVPQKLKLGPYQKTLIDIFNETNTFFDLTEKAFKEDDVEAAKEVLTNYRVISKNCDGLLHQIFIDHKDKDQVDKDLISLVLLVRFFKRLNAHLKNISSTVINPFHRIGYKLKNKS
jgi:phosphate transport system protein